jgi:hypothetical protein
MTTGFYEISDEEIGQIIELTEDLCFLPTINDRLVDERHVAIARKRMDVVNTIRARETAHQSIALTTFEQTIREDERNRFAAELIKTFREENCYRHGYMVRAATIVGKALRNPTNKEPEDKE